MLSGLLVSHAVLRRELAQAERLLRSYEAQAMTDARRIKAST
jgi:hypothetical protein